MRLKGMRITFHRLALAAVMAFTGASCTTAYDYYGRPRTVVEPGAASSYALRYDVTAALCAPGFFVMTDRPYPIASLSVD